MGFLVIEGVEVKPKVTIASVQPAPEGVSGVTLNLSDGSSLHADHVVMAVGAEPNVQLAQEAGLELDEKRGGILTNAELEARSNVFVCFLHSHSCLINQPLFV